MPTAESLNQKVTGNASHFKKLFAHKPVMPLSDALEKDTTEADTQSISPSNTPQQDQEHTEDVTEPILRKSTYMLIPTRRLI